MTCVFICRIFQRISFIYTFMYVYVYIYTYIYREREVDLYLEHCLENTLSTFALLRCSKYAT